MEHVVVVIVLGEIDLGRGFVDGAATALAEDAIGFVREHVVPLVIGGHGLGFLVRHVVRARTRSGPPDA